MILPPLCLLLIALMATRSSAYVRSMRSNLKRLTFPLKPPLYTHQSVLNEKEEKMNIYEVISNIGQAGFVPVQLINRFVKKALTSNFALNISMMFALFGTMDVLGSALERKRLDSMTFKYLNLGVLFSSIIYSVRAFTMRGSILKSGTLAFALVTASGITAGSKLHKYGLPNPKKLTLSGEKGFCPFTSKMYAFAFVATIAHVSRTLQQGKTAWGAALGLAYSSISAGLLPVVLLIQHQACLLKRLSSKTYKDMNWMLLLVSAVAVVTAPYGTFRLSTLTSGKLGLDKCLFLASTLSMLAGALLGLQIGYTT